MSAAVMASDERRKKIFDVLRVASGNFLEQYDFFVFGYFATYIGTVFFPNTDPVLSTISAFAAFGVGFFMRPLGAMFLGAYIDRKGRRVGLLLTLGMMAVGTLTIAVTPGYASIGIAAPIIVVLGRLLQGFSAGVELGGVSIYLAEIATPGRRGFYTSWQSGSQQIAVILASVIGVAVQSSLSEAAMKAWGWRVPLLIGCAIIPLIFWLRSSLTETDAFRRMKQVKRSSEVFAIMARNWRLILTGAAISVLTTTTFYLITAYTPTFGKTALSLDSTGVLEVTIVVGLSNFIWLPIGGMISDKIGRYPLLLLIPVVTILSAYPVMLWLVGAPSFPKLLTVVLLFSMFFGLYNGSMIPLLAELMPPSVRTAGFSVAFAVATALFGGATPYVSENLIKWTGDRASPALWLTVAAVVSFVGAVFARRRIVQSEMEH